MSEPTKAEILASMSQQVAELKAENERLRKEVESGESAIDVWATHYDSLSKHYSARVDEWTSEKQRRMDAEAENERLRAAVNAALLNRQNWWETCERALNPEWQPPTPEETEP